MLIPTTVFCALRCPECGCLEVYSLSLFALGGGRSCWLECSCGTPLLGIGRQKGNCCWLQLNCTMCGNSHFWPVARRDLWGGSLRTLICEDTGLEVGFLGPGHLVRRAVTLHERSLAELAQDLGLVGEGWLGNACGGNNNTEA
ncbi:hypothetical protein [Thermanaeromonas sp. C210]|uniref:hypothetical protein n=1 Tax=Thermanaeromonas sp. C210 TaxID=2731925 RepID=UPI00155B5ED9|nr:hypothetical protein [Thermanaeromonas sp. C210]GFN22995.1 hypothetical protein TAMC210_13120 [Thermanaeromonas sp. C210]